MQVGRRTLLQWSALGGVALVANGAIPARETAAIDAVAFDALAIFDPRPVFALALSMFPHAGDRLVETWRTRQFEYAWLRTLSRTYVDFWKVTEQALEYAAKVAHVQLTSGQRDALMGAFLELKPWPDAPPAVHTLQKAGFRLALLSNFSPHMLESVVGKAGLGDIALLSTNRVRAYKPDPRAYQMAVDYFRVPASRIAFVAFGGWDAAGARVFGFPTFWANRMQLPEEQLDHAPDATEIGLLGLTQFITARTSA
jgi:2-haloacid dehalogenase